GLAGLLGHQRVAEHLADVLQDFLDRSGQAHAALGIRAEFLELALAASAGMDLALHDVERTGERLRGSLRLSSLEDRDAFGNRRAVTLEELLGLIFVDVH